MGNYFTNNSKIELILSNNIVKLTNYRNTEKGRVYLLDAERLYQVMKVGGKKQIIPTYGDDNFALITFVTAHHPAGKHISSANDGINTYISNDDYELIIEELKKGIKDESE